MTNQGPGFFRKRNCPASPASGMGAMRGTKRTMSRNDATAHTATNKNAARHDTRLASSVPPGTPSMFATVCPSTMMETARPSRPGSANSFATMVAVPKNAPCGRPDTKRAATSTSAFGARDAAALPATMSATNPSSSRFGGTRRPNTRNSVPTHTPRAYAEMKVPASGTLTCRPAAVTGRMPIITNSANPSANDPVARAMRLFFMGRAILRAERGRVRGWGRAKRAWQERHGFPSCASMPPRARERAKLVENITKLPWDGGEAHPRVWRLFEDVKIRWRKGNICEKVYLG